MTIPWGYHLVVDCGAGNIDRITDKENIRRFVLELVDRIDMVAFGNLWIERFALHDPDKTGISFVQMIETSNITGHFVEKSGDFYIDVFSCKTFDTETVIQVISKYFEPSTTKHNLILRSA